jgi:hypothetical protein
LDGIDQNQGADMKPSTDQRRTAYYRADVQGLNAGDAATRTLDPNAGIEADPDAAEDNLGELFVRSPWGAVADIVDEKEK